MSSSREPGDKEKKRTVPKFASFKPKSAPEPEPKPESDEKDGEHRRRVHDDRREHDSEHERERLHRYEQGLSRKDAPRQSRNVTASGGGNDLFFIDKRGDPLILQYGANDRGKVPSYYRFGAGKLLGSPNLFSIHRDGTREEFAIRSRNREGASAFRDRDAILATAARRTNAKRIRPSPDAKGLPTASDDFISLEPPRKCKREEDGRSSVPEYRSIYRKVEEAESDSDGGSHAPEEDGVLVEMTSTKKRSIELSRRVRDNPGDIPSWLELIKLQDALFWENQAGDAAGGGQLRTAEEAKGLAELKLSLYEEALPNADQPGDHDRVLEGLMREGSRVWDSKTLAKRWDEVSKGHQSFVLWRALLDFELAKVATCSYEDLRGFITDKLQLLGQALQQPCHSGEDGADRLAPLCDQLAYVFLRLTRFLHDTGYVELGVAAWQAMLELTFCRPARLPQEAGGSFMSSFTEFWESEVPRIGEDGAKGWRHFVEDAEGAANPPDPRTDKPGEMPRTRDVFKAWAIMESQTAAKSRMPARTLDEGAEDDPYRVVMFSDIKDFLVWVPASALLQAGPRLLDAFLLFCERPTARLTDGLVDAAQNDPFIAGRSEAFGAGASRTAGASLDQTKKTPESKQQGGNMALCQDVLFPSETWFRYLNKRDDSHPPRAGQVELHWVLGTLRYLVRNCGFEALAEYYLAMEWLNEPSGARKVAKGLLKQFSSNIRLYSAYARVEWVNGSADISEKVLSAATSMGLSSTSPDSQLLWNTWTWIHLESGQKQAALSRLCSSVDRKLEGSPPPPALLLKVKSHFSSTRDYALSSQKLETAIQHAESLALLEYLTAEGSTEAASEMQGNITAALESIQHFSDELTSRDLGPSTFHERILQTASHMIYYHATHGPYRPSYVRTEFKHFATLFPRNTLFLELWSWAESFLRIDDPVRNHLQHTALIPPHDCLSTHRFAIQHEARTGTAHSTRAAFEAALDSDACKGNADLWVWYLRFCHGEKELKWRAKELFYRAIAACPMVKEVYMEAFGTLVKDMGSAELRAVFNTMAVKGLRIHVDLESLESKWRK